MVSRPKVKRVLFFVVPVLAIGGNLAGSSGVSAGTATYGVDYFISPPLVQGSYVAGTSETFDLLATGACPGSFSIAGGTIAVTVAGTGTCNLMAADANGGASAGATDPTPTVGGSGSRYLFLHSDEVTLTMPAGQPQRYLGFYWTAGSDGNIVTFYSGDTQVLQLDTEDLFGLLGSRPVDEATYGSTGTITSTGGTSYVKHHYFGNPQGVSGAANPPVMNASLWWNNTTNYGPSKISSPFVYVHVFGQGGMTFDRVVFSGSYFEVDNVVLSSLPSVAPTSDLVRLGSIEGTPPPDFNPPGGGGGPEIDLDRYTETTEMPNTGRRAPGLEWIAAGFVAAGTALVGARRRSRQV